MRPSTPVRRASIRIKRRLSSLVPPIKRTDSQDHAPEGGMEPPPAHHAPNGGFRNPWPSAQVPGWTEIISGGNPLSWASSNLHTHEKAKRIKVVKPDWGLSLDNPPPPSLLAPGHGPRLLATWLGHAAAFVQVPLARSINVAKHSGVVISQPQVSILFDPIFSQRAGPTSYTGPSRINQVPCAVDDLPACEIVCISHNQSVLSLESFGNSLPRYEDRALTVAIARLDGRALNLVDQLRSLGLLLDSSTSQAFSQTQVLCPTG